MGKPTGFLEYDRMTGRAADPKSRIKNYDEFHLPLSEKDRDARELAAWTAACRSASRE